MIVKLLTEHHLEFLSLKGGCRGSPESTHVLEISCHGSFPFSISPMPGISSYTSYIFYLFNCTCIENRTKDEEFSVLNKSVD